MRQATYDLGNGYKVYAGQSDDPFYVDLGAIFDLLTIRPGAPGDRGGGVDGLGGFNCQTIALQVPIAALTRNHAMPADAKDPNAIIGVYAPASRRGDTSPILGGRPGGGDDQGEDDRNRGDRGDSEDRDDEAIAWRQVSRLGMPLTNEVIIHLADKDRWNRTDPVNDSQFLEYFANPEPAGLLHAIYGLDVPANPRNDIVAVFNAGLEGVNQPANVVPADLLRLNMLEPLSATPNRLGLLVGQLDGFPNGRRLTDDVVDIELRALAGVLAGKNIAPNNLLGDGVDRNDLDLQASFPYVSAAHQGFEHTHHRVEPVTPPPPPEAVGAAGAGSASSGEVEAARAPSVIFASKDGGRGAAIRYSQPAAGHVTVRVYNVRGQLVRTIVDQDETAGAHSVAWDGANETGNAAGSGMYFYRAELGGKAFDQKMILFR